MTKTKYVLLKAHATDGDAYRVSGAVVKVDDLLRARIDDLRRRQRRAKADLEVFEDSPTWVDDTDFKTADPDEEFSELDDGWDPDDYEVSQVEFLSEATLHVSDTVFWWSCYEKHADVTYETPLIRFEQFDLAEKPPPQYQTLGQIYDAHTKLWQRERALGRYVPRALAREIRPWLAEHPEVEWVRVFFDESDQEGSKLVALVTDSAGVHAKDPMKGIDDELTSYPVFDAAFEVGDFVRVTRDKIYVKKGWKRR